MTDREGITITMAMGNVPQAVAMELQKEYAERYDWIVNELSKQITAKKCLRHFGDYGILNIKKDICANRCPTGATDRRLARLVKR